MRFDVPLVSFALLGATSAAAFGPGGYGPGANVDHQYAGQGRPQELGQLEGEIEKLEQELEKDLKEFEHLGASWNHRPAPYHPGEPSYAESSAVTAAPAGYSTASSSILASLSSVKASLSSAISLVSSVNATVTATSTVTGTAYSTVIPVGYHNYTVPVPYANSTSSVGIPASYTAASSSESSASPASYAPTSYAYSPAGSSSSAASTVSPVSYEASTSVSSLTTVTSAATTTYASPCPYETTSISGDSTIVSSLTSYSTVTETFLTTVTLSGAAPSGYSAASSSAGSPSVYSSAPSAYESVSSAVAGPSGPSAIYSSLISSYYGGSASSESASSAGSPSAVYSAGSSSSSASGVTTATPTSAATYASPAPYTQTSISGDSTIVNTYTSYSIVTETFQTTVTVSTAAPSWYSGASSASSAASAPGYSGAPYYPVGNSSAYGYPTASGSAVYSTGTAPVGTAPVSKPIVSANSTAAFGTGTGTTSAPTHSATMSTSCANLCSQLSFDTDYATYPISCQAYDAGSTIEITGGQATAGCGSSVNATVDMCRVVLTVVTSGISSTYMEVWLPNGNETSWNGRTLSTDNGGANGCVAFDDMQYVTGLGFAAIGDNGGHNNSAFDGGWMYFNNEAILDWGSRSRHGSVQAGKQVAAQFYSEKPSYSYYLGCSTGGQQGMHSAQYAPGDFDGIVAGSAAANFNYLQGWSNRFIQMTGTSTDDDRFLTQDQWIFVQSYIFDQCDAALDGVNDGIIEDPTICKFDPSVIPVCDGNSTDGCLTSTQVSTVYNVFSELYNDAGDLLYPSMLYGSQVDAFRLGMLSGSPQAIAVDWYGGGVWNNSNYDYIDMNQTDYAQANSEDALHGYISTMKGDLSEFQATGAKMITYHGMADPLVSGGNSQLYYLKVAQTMGMSNTQLDDFYRYYRISGMAHCGVGGISGAGAWMFGQSAAADVEGVGDNIIDNMIDWVENGNAPDTVLGTKFNYDTPSLGIQFQRPHCRFPYRTTYDGTGNSDDPASWTCEYIKDWQECGPGAHPRLCNADGSFTP